MSLFNGIETPHVLITGASQGIGLGFVQQLLQNPQIVRIYATYRQSETATGLLQIQDDRLICLPLEITAEDQIERLVGQIQPTSDRLHLVVNCIGLLHAGSLQPEKNLNQLNAENLTRYFQVNSIGAVLLAKHLLPLLKHGDRSILATISAKLASISDNHLGGWYGYRASKTALNMFMHTAAIEYARKRSNAIITVLHPGTTDTQLSQPFQRHVPEGKLFTVERTVNQLLDVLAQLTLADSGAFFSWDGSRLPW